MPTECLTPRCYLFLKIRLSVNASCLGHRLLVSTSAFFSMAGDARTKASLEISAHTSLRHTCRELTRPDSSCVAMNDVTVT